MRGDDEIRGREIIPEKIISMPRFLKTGASVREDTKCTAGARWCVGQGRRENLHPHRVSRASLARERGMGWPLQHILCNEPASVAETRCLFTRPSPEAAVSMPSQSRGSSAAKGAACCGRASSAGAECRDWCWICRATRSRCTPSASASKFARAGSFR